MQTTTAPVAASSRIESESFLYLGDPFVLKYKGYYYLYGTDERGADTGIPVYRSKDLTRWEGPLGKRDGYALLKGDSYGEKGFWAPFIVVRNDRFYLFYTANEQIAVAVSDSPLGPFVQQEKRPFPSDCKEIDPHVSLDKDGKAYLYYNRLEKGNRIFVEELSQDLLSRKTETRVACIHATEPWENTANAPWPVTEAACTIVHQGWRYLLYTANDFRNPDYGVGYATSKSPFGPWTKYAQNPILRRDAIVQGTGSCEIVEGLDGELVMFYHVHNSSRATSPRKVAFSKCRFVPQPGSAPPVLEVASARHFATRAESSKERKP